MMEEKDDPKLCGVLHDEIDEVWNLFLPLIEKALKLSDDKYKSEDIKSGIKTRDLQLWAAARDQKPTSCLVTKIIKYPQETSLLMMLYAGEHTKHMTQFLKPIYEWAKQHGCTRVEIYGRSGWERLLKSEGYKKIHTVLRMKL